jgi:biopolymer transport protein ExbD
MGVCVSWLAAVWSLRFDMYKVILRYTTVSFVLLIIFVLSYPNLTGTLTQYHQASAQTSTVDWLNDAVQALNNNQINIATRDLNVVNQQLEPGLAKFDVQNAIQELQQGNTNAALLDTNSAYHVLSPGSPTICMSVSCHPPNPFSGSTGSSSGSTGSTGSSSGGPILCKTSNCLPLNSNQISSICPNGSQRAADGTCPSPSPSSTTTVDPCTQDPNAAGCNTSPSPDNTNNAVNNNQPSPSPDTSSPSGNSGSDTTDNSQSSPDNSNSNSNNNDNNNRN